jgi:hypothetical protein
MSLPYPYMFDVLLYSGGSFRFGTRLSQVSALQNRYVQ